MKQVSRLAHDAPTGTPAATAQSAATPWHVLGMQDLQDHILDILDTAATLKVYPEPLPQLLAGKTVLLLFEKNSTRTRISFEVGIQKLGGIVSTLDAGTSQLARGESLHDTAKVLSRYADVLVYRAKDHASAQELARHATVPVVNSLTDLEHPCQILADLLTLQEKWGRLAGRTLAYVGDGNNMCHSYLLGAAMVGMHIHVATPAAYAPNKTIIAQAKAIAKANGTRVLITTDPHKAVRSADAVATDTWISMGDEADETARLAAFKGFTVTEELMAKAAPNALFVHCLPGHWGHEATEEVAYGPRSVIWDEAENRLWVQAALLLHLLGVEGQL